MKSKHILLVDDNEGDLLMAREVLEESKMISKISFAYNGQDALDFIFKEGIHSDANSPDLILMDINMPLLNGLEVLDRIKKNPKTLNIPIAMFSTSSLNKDVNSAYQKHANCYIKKPIDYDEYCEALSAIESFWLRTVCLPELH